LNKDKNIESFDETNKQEKKLSRRDFLLGTGVVVAGSAIGAGLLSSCTPEPVTETVEITKTKEVPTTVVTTNTVEVEKTYDFEKPLTPISSSDIKETVNVDVVVLGAGVSGIAAAASAAEAGANTICLEAYSFMGAPGSIFEAFNTQEQIAAGITFDKATFLSQLFSFSNGRSDMRLLAKWVEQSGPAMDWLIGLADAVGMPHSKFGPNAFVFGEDVMSPMLGLASDPAYELMANYGISKGLAIRYNIRAEQLIRPNNQGRVTGVIAKNSDGTYSQFNASKGVVICTGGHGGNPEMMEKYADWAAHPDEILNTYRTHTNNGDGLKMSLHIGAWIQEENHCAMIHFFSTNKKPPTFGRPVFGAGLCVNKFGDRFSNESPGGDELRAPIVLRQPGRTQWQIWDSKTTVDEETLNTMLGTGEITSADTIEGLAATFGANPAKLKAAVDRYNEIIALNEDSDFGRAPGTYGPTNDTPPYYACESPADILVCTGGPMVNNRMQVLDTNTNVIPGLYAAGNAMGGLYGNSYPMAISSGMAHGSSFTFGRIAGINAASA
jgi:fumarate reductase flavoprotein subunit